MLLLIGADSEIGSATLRHLKMLGQAVAGTTRRLDGAGPDRHVLDLARPLEDWKAPKQTRAACVFVAIARLAACAADPVSSAYINVEQTLSLIERLTGQGIHVLFLSTNQVFDGSEAHVRADARTSPVSEYGRQKARTEEALLRRMNSGAPIAILRLAKVVSPNMELLRGWTRTLRSGKPIRAFHDMTMAPAPTATVTAAIAALLTDQARGVFQLTGPRDVSYAQVGHYIAERIGAAPGLVEPVEAASTGMPEGATPRHTTLDSSHLRERYGITVPDPFTVTEPVIAGAMIETN